MPDTDPAQTATLALPARLDTPALAALRETLSSRQDGDLELDASGVTMLGARCFELLLAAAGLWAAAGHRFAIVRQSEAFRADLASLGAEASIFEKGHPS